ncbi:Poly(RC)-binding protein 4 [Fasciolopsis buskii]|uniref:Poly(RC)-binding protein 4 n=1 Tax=Fasciolopsis buskii TaxID=27845 RepID=A0A8E0RZA4_9TREM|nr:Poly(RC)-binding protein 4 [Fasciolopsis buski]
MRLSSWVQHTMHYFDLSHPKVHSLHVSQAFSQPVRYSTGASVKITDGSSPERIITVSGSVQQVTNAFECICRTFEEDQLRSATRLVDSNRLPASSCPPITLRLLIPEHLCGPVIGKGGSKIKSIREVSPFVFSVIPYIFTLFLPASKLMVLTPNAAN